MCDFTLKKGRRNPGFTLNKKKRDGFSLHKNKKIDIGPLITLESKT